MTNALRKASGGLALFGGVALLLLAGRALWLHRSDVAARVLPTLGVLLVAAATLALGRFLVSARPWRRWVLAPALLLIPVSAGMLAYFVSVAYVEAKLPGQSYAGVYGDCYKVWAARGLVLESSVILPDGPQNSIESIGLAFESGAKGTEVDVFYDPEMQDFVVSHDRPYNLKNGELLMLGTLLEATAADDRWFWLDFKKLRHLDAESLRGAVARLEALTRENGLKQRMYVEGEDPRNLSAFRDAGFPTIMDTHPLPDGHPFGPALINLYKVLFYFGDFTVMAMNYGEIDDPIYGPRTRASLGAIPVFLYHLEDGGEVLESLCALDAVRVILVQNQSLNRYGVTACE